MDSLKSKLEKNIEIFNAKTSNFYLKKEIVIKTNGIHERFVNWVTGEFDLNLKIESETLKVFFPNGWFCIRNFKDEKNKDLIEIIVEGKSKTACQKIMNQLESVHNHVVRFNEVKEIQFA